MLYSRQICMILSLWDNDPGQYELFKADGSAWSALLYNIHFL